MSTNKPLSKEQIRQKSDENFIDSFYQNLPESLLLDSELPDVELDHKIHRIAQQAIEKDCACVVTFAGKRKRSWYVTLASAASLLLIVSLFFNQYQLPSVKSPLEAQYDEKIDGKGDELHLKKIARVGLEQGQKELIVDEAMAYAVKAQRMVDAKNMLEAQSFEIKSNGLIQKNRSQSQRSISSKAQILTKQQFNYFKKNNASWQLVQEDSDFYIIKVAMATMSASAQGDFFKLDKKHFSFTGDELKQGTFSKVEIIEE